MPAWALLGLLPEDQFVVRNQSFRKGRGRAATRRSDRPSPPCSPSVRLGWLLSPLRTRPAAFSLQYIPRHPSLRPGVALRRDGPVPQEPAQLFVLLQHHRVAPLQVRDQPLLLGALRGQAVDLQLRLTQVPPAAPPAPPPAAVAPCLAPPSAASPPARNYASLLPLDSSRKAAPSATSGIANQ